MGLGPVAGGPRAARETALGLLARRFAEGDIDEDEYGQRLSVLRKGGHPYGDGPG